VSVTLEQRGDGKMYFDGDLQ